MNRVAAGLAFALMVSACGGATTSSASPASTGAASLTTNPTASPSSIPAPTPQVRDLALFPLPQADDLFRGARIASIAGGRAGAVILGTDKATGALISWTSADGDNWERHWLPGSTFGGGSPERLVGGDFGFLAFGWQFEGSAVSSALWSSPDGVSWSPAAATGLPTANATALVAGPAGIIAQFDVEGSTSAVVVSADGRTWRKGILPSDAIPDPNGIVALPDGFLLTGTTEHLDSSGGTVATRTVWRSRDGSAWSADIELTGAIFARPNSIEGWALSSYGAVGWDNGGEFVNVTEAGLGHISPPPMASGRMMGSPAGLFWVGQATLDGACSLAWQYNGLRWVPLGNTSKDPGCPEPESIALGSAPLTDGAILYGLSGPDLLPVAWLIRSSDQAPTAAVTGGPVPTAPSTSIPDPLALTFDHLSTCPALPGAVDVVLKLDPYLAAGCFGDHDLQFRAWIVDPGDGYGGTCEAFVPRWIRECVLADYLFSDGTPGDPTVGVGSSEIHGMRSPSATGDLTGVSRWVLVTGHYNDAASPTCRFSGEGEIGFGPEQPRALAVLQCRLVFVVTDLTTVPA